ncbi:radical SAM protein [Campylobacter geochelonis]|uniref:Quinone-reactive Ni/Fe hydrogenase, large subunit n=1 Tax=Campylobacter geochelonis TaxID=1780362 RepID=A0A128ECT8_9BACT|nr:radical SAM protein [Campylobacter geochelonis]QKF72083.1 putative coproporphyrinogen III oxidase [Campylobacter geochelonis]CZE46769.1 quinone-reactive Ni/Fe hydrogenase%2C large subunit [Campylobacter geochelonis]
MFKQRVKGHHREALEKPVMASKDELESFLQNECEDKEGVIYFHIPFCDNICSFCNLHRTKLDDELDEYVKFLLKEIDYYAKFPYIKTKIFKSVYFGGGTPTILKQRHLEQILNAINKSFSLDKDVEFSFETTLHNLTQNKIELMHALGVNRYSIGIQTFSTRGRKILNRIGDKKSAIDKLAMIKESFGGLVCTDIIYNYPKQSIQEVLEDAKVLKSLKIDSSSFYSLQFQEGSIFSKQYDENYYDLQTDYKLHNAFLTSLLKDEYELLEYTKINRKNRDRYLYIKLSHKGTDILPIGVGAGGRVGLYSIFTPRQNMQVVSKTSQIQLNFNIYSNLFQYDKISITQIKSFLDKTTFEKIEEFFKACEKKGYVKIENGVIKFSADGVFWGNSIAWEAIELAKDYFIEKLKKAS